MLNNIIIKNKYPLPLINKLHNRLQRTMIFIILDIRSAYNFIKIKKGKEWKIAFRTRYDLYEYQVMPFGLTNAPASYQ